ncbi:MAG: hypothetical protein ABR600_06010 [Actinomycetota bacterium]|nr:hypothetical protein [Actinomycetota bacterium]
MTDQPDVWVKVRSRTRTGEWAKGDVLSLVEAVAGELRGPLTPLKGYLLSLTGGAIEDSAETRQEYYDAMLRQVAKLERLVETLDGTPVIIINDDAAPVVALDALRQTARGVANREAGDGGIVEEVEGARGHG